MGVEMTFRPNLPDEIVKRLNHQKRFHGISKIHMVTRAIELYLDILEGKAEIVYHNSSPPEEQHVR